MGPSNKYRPEDQLDQVALYWFNVCGAKPEPLSIRVLGKDRDVRLDIAGGSQIPKPGAAAAESARLLAELRKSWHGVEKLLLAYDGSPLSRRLPRHGHELPRPGHRGHADRRRRGRSTTRRRRRRRRRGRRVIERGRRAGPRAGPRRRLPGRSRRGRATRSSARRSRASSTPSS